MAPSLGCGGLFRRQSSSSSDPSKAEWRRKSVKLREGTFLHGELQVDIQEARDLPDTDNFLCNIKRCLGQEKDVTDPYVAVQLDSTRIITTSVVYNNLCPQWNEFFRVSVCHYAKKLLFRVKDQDELGTEMVGEVSISVQELLDKPGMKIHGWQDIIDDQRKVQGQLFVKVLYRPYLEEDEGADFACRDCYFPLRDGNRVTLFSCARNVDFEHRIPLDAAGSSCCGYSPPSLWIDVFRSIVASERFIYITGWSVHVKIKLLRGDDRRLLKCQSELNACGLTLGELLKKKAESGVRVLIMIWGETTSIMGTHDTETENYFKGTGVYVARVGRQSKTREVKDLEAHFTANLGYSHHQKAVILDAPVHGGHNRQPDQMKGNGENGENCLRGEESKGPRRIVAYVGGIDLTDGRYDTPSHHLFRTLPTEHRDDFYQPCEPQIKANVGPRLPWQDIHAKIEGPAARDVMINFVERWGKERPLNSRLLMQDVRLPDYDFSPLSHLPDSEAWNVQVFRSITSDAARFQLENETSFTTKKGRSVDNSIARAYTAAIRRAERFIYVENQYFMGSAYGWLDDQDVHCYNVIPMEITQKICESIDAGRRFTVYIVIPLHPEGIPTDNAIQEMLHWQKRTMHMMYSRIAHALHIKGIKAHPTEYLMFFCLGKKERTCDVPTADLAHPPMASRAAKLRKSRRLMIYVHSKLMIVDDSYILTGSANINQRSLDGDRDSELAIGAYQPHRRGGGCSSGGGGGEVFLFRMSLFREHLSRSDPVLADPRSEACASFVREAALQNWRDFEEKEGEPEGHLLSYPIDVIVNIDDDVPVVQLLARTNNKRFPDSKAKILGKAARSIPNKLTT